MTIVACVIAFVFGLIWGAGLWDMIRAEKSGYEVRNHNQFGG